MTRHHQRSRIARYTALGLVPAMLLLGACRTDDDTTPTPKVVDSTPAAPAPVPQRPVVAAAPAAPVAVRPNGELHGHVVSIEPIEQTEKPSGAGAVVGGLLGGVLGHQIGGGDGKKIATVGGAVGGALVGNRVEKNRSNHVVGYRVSVRTDSGNVRHFERQQVGDLSVGGAVRIVDGSVQPA